MNDTKFVVTANGIGLIFSGAYLTFSGPELLMGTAFVSFSIGMLCGILLVWRIAE